MTQQPQTPEHDRLIDTSEKAQAIRAFLGWAACIKGIYLAEDREWEDEEPTAQSVALVLSEDDPNYETELVHHCLTLGVNEHRIERLLTEFFERREGRVSDHDGPNSCVVKCS